MRDLDTAWMVDVAAGNAPRALRVLAASHAEMNAAARQSLSHAEAVMGALLDTTPPAELSRQSYQRMQALLDDEAEAPLAPRPTETSAWPDALAQVLREQGETEWTRKLGGYEELDLPALSEPGVKARLIRLPAGKGVARHSHDGSELTLILSGGFNDGHADYWAGDVCEADAMLDHNPVAHSDGPCVCLAVEFGRLKFSHPLIALADHLLGWSRH